MEEAAGHPRLPRNLPHSLSQPPANSLLQVHSLTQQAQPRETHLQVGVMAVTVVAIRVTAAELAAVTVASVEAAELVAVPRRWAQ